MKAYGPGTPSRAHAACMQVQPHDTPLLSTVLLLHAVGVPPPTSQRLRRRVLGVCKATVQQAQQPTQLQREQTKPQHRRQQQRPPPRRLAAEWELSIPANAGARAITREISGCRSWRDLRDTADRHAADLNPIHVAALLAKAAKFVPPDSPAWSKSAAEVAAEECDELRQWVTRGLLPLFDRKLEVLGPRGTANGLWALAKAGCPLPAPLMRRAAGALLQHAPRLEGQHLSSFVWALARWAQLSEERAAAAALAREAATTSSQAHSQQRQRQAAGQSSSSSGTQDGGSSIASDELLTGAAVESGPRAAAAELVPGLSPARLQELLDAAAHCLPAAGSQVHSNLLYGLACLRHRPPAPWMAGFWAASLPALPEAQPQHLSNALWAAARLGAPPPEPWLRAWAAAAARRLLRSTSQGCSNMVWAAATLGWDPGEQWMAAWLAATRPRLVGFPEQAFSISCWALGRMARRRRLRREAAEVDWQLGEAAAGAAAAAARSGAGVCGDGTDGESGKEALWRGGEEGRPSAPTREQQQQETQQQEYAQEQQREQQEQQQQRDQRQDRETHGSAPDVRTLTDAWVSSGLAVAQGRAAAYTARQLSTTLWGLGCLLPAGGGSKGGAAGGGAAVEALFFAAAARMGEMNPQELSNVLLSAARLGVRPGAAWMGLYEGASAALLADSHAQHHANVLWAMARLGHAPGDGWVAALAGDAEARLLAAADEAAAAAAAAAAGAAAALQGESSGGGDGGAAGVELPSAAARGAAVAAERRRAGLAPPRGRQLSAGLRRWEAGAAEAQETVRALSPWRYTPEGAAALAWGLSRVAPGRAPAGLWAALEADAARRMGAFPPRAIALLLWARAAEGCGGGGSGDDLLFTALEAEAPRIASDALLIDCAMVLWALAKRRRRPPPGLVLPWVQRSRSLLECHPARARRAATGAQGAPAASGGSRGGAAAVGPATAAGAAAVAQPSAVMLWSLGRLGFHPGSPWLRAFFAATAGGQLLGSCTPRQLAMLLWGLAALREAPPAGWMREWRAAWGRAGAAGASDAADQAMVRAALRALR